jgi:hypothetical protein
VDSSTLRVFFQLFELSRLLFFLLSRCLLLQ